MNGIKIYQGNRLEDLARYLGEVIHAGRRENFSLEPDIVLVNNFEMARWLSNTIAESQGICANVNFMLTGSFIWRLATGTGNGMGGAISMEQMRWLIFRALQDIESGAGVKGDFSVLRRYILEQGEKGMFHLAGQLAELFDRYLTYRHDMLLEWEEGRSRDEHGWQPDLWKLLSSITGGRLRISFLRALLGRLESGRPEVMLPSGRLCLFGVSCLPPLHLEIISAIAEHVDTRLFFMNPCRQFWEDVLPEKKRAGLRLRLSPEQVDAWFPEGNRLLASFGYSGRSFMSRLYALPIEEGRDFFRKSGSSSLLAMIQDDILELDSGEGDSGGAGRAVSSGDTSIVINSCHSRMREVEVLHDELVGIFDACPDISPHDCLVMAPSIDEYSPYVDAVFGAAPARRFIPYTLADVGMVNNNTASRAFLDIFTLPLSDFTAPVIMDILALPDVSARQGLDSDGIAILREWVRRSGIRQGIGMERLGSEGGRRGNSWEFGLDRLFVTHAIDSLEWFGDILPMDCPVEGNHARLLAVLSGFVFRLSELAELMTRSGGFLPSEWFALFEKLVSGFIAHDPWMEDGSAGLMKRLESLAAAMNEAGVGKVAHDVMCDILQKELGRPGSSRTFFSGKVLFSSLVPMRTIPCRVICLLGMNDADFPRRPGVPGFDLMALQPRAGDRIPREEDRYLFLETLLSARERLVISYVGRSEHDDSVQNPSVVVSELMDYIDSEFVFSDAGPETPPVSSALFRQHPLQPFSLRYLERDSGLSGFASEWLPVDETGAPLTKISPPEFCPSPIPLAENELDSLSSISPGQIVFFFANPVKYFLLNRLNVDLWPDTRLLDGNEPFTFPRQVQDIFVRELAGLEGDSFLEVMENPEPFLTALLRRIKGMGLAPEEPFASLLWLGEHDKFSGFVTGLGKRIGQTGFPDGMACVNRKFVWPDETCLAKSKTLVTGSLGRKSDNGGIIDIRFRVYTSHRLGLWIRHLLLVADSGKDEKVCAGMKSAVAQGNGTPVVIRGVSGTEAQRLLERLLSFYLMGHERPIHFFPDASYIYAKHKNPWNGEPGSGHEEQAVKKAVEALYHWNSPGVLKDPFLNLVYRGDSRRVEEIIAHDEEFRTVSEAVCGSMLKFMEKGR